MFLFNESKLDLKVPSFKLVKFVFFFRISLAVTLLIGVLFLSGCSSANSAVAWQLVGNNSNLVPLARQAVTENTELSLDDSASVLVMNLSTNKQKGQELFLLDYNTESLCGRRGCLYSIYSRQGQTSKLIWSEYLQPNLPPGVNLFTLVWEDSNASGFPCLDVKQLNGNRLQKLVYCFDGNNYRLVSRELFNKTY
ncbi:hypothetical protein C7Y66_22350 [Chroococcidiopsis sp. CCALA 051]|nr:hypothetical protein C7Y66_22350 [Chroococcidiopsis sp. CCALA 051]